MTKKSIIVIVLFLLVIIPAEAQCSMCRAVLESEEGQNAARGINNGILYLMVIPYILIGGVGYFIHKNKKKAKAVS